MQAADDLPMIRQGSIEERTQPIFSTGSILPRSTKIFNFITKFIFGISSKQHRHYMTKCRHLAQDFFRQISFFNLYILIV